jgi:hypothetical protein
LGEVKWPIGRGKRWERVGKERGRVWDGEFGEGMGKCGGRLGWEGNGDIVTGGQNREFGHRLILRRNLLCIEVGANTWGLRVRRRGEGWSKGNEEGQKGSGIEFEEDVCSKRKLLKGWDSGGDAT